MPGRAGRAAAGADSPSASIDWTAWLTVALSVQAMMLCLGPEAGRVFTIGHLAAHLGVETEPDSDYCVPTVACIKLISHDFNLKSCEITRVIECRV